MYRGDSDHDPDLWTDEERERALLIVTRGRELPALLALETALREDLAEPWACIGCQNDEPLDENGKHIIDQSGARWQCRTPRAAAALKRLDELRRGGT